MEIGICNRKKRCVTYRLTKTLYIIAQTARWATFLNTGTSEEWRALRAVKCSSNVKRLRREVCASRKWRNEMYSVTSEWAAARRNWRHKSSISSHSLWKQRGFQRGNWRASVLAPLVRWFTRASNHALVRRPRRTRGKFALSQSDEVLCSRPRRTKRIIRKRRRCFLP